MAGRTNWWTVTLISVAVLFAGAALTVLIGFVVMSYAFSDENFGPHDLDANGAAQAMEQRRIGIPDAFTFQAMTVIEVFTGADSYSGRYSFPGSFDDAKHALAESNLDFPPLRRARCDDEIVVHDFPGITGFNCGPNTELAVSTRSSAGNDVLTDNYSGTPPDAETVLLVGNGDHVDLFVLSQGH